METILFRYREDNTDYLVYDTVRFHDLMRPRAVRSICSRNCGSGTAGIMVGPVNKGGQLVMKMYSPEGEELQMDEHATRAGDAYLQDAGYLQHTDCAHAEAVGKIFLSDKFVKTYMQAG